VIVYLVDYRAGFLTLFALSLAHVVLEFPLNVRAMVGVGNEVGRALKAHAYE
jgi:hypothetical protein